MDIDVSGANPYIVTNLNYLVGHARGGTYGAYLVRLWTKCPKDHSYRQKSRAQYPLCTEQLRGGGKWHDEVCP